MSASVDERRRLAAERRLAQLGRAERDAQGAVDGVLVRRVGKRLERGDVGGRAGRAHERRAEPLRLGGDELDRHALDRDADGAPLGPLDDGDDLRQAGEPLEQRRRLVGRAHHREPLARVAPAPDVAGRLAAERGRDAADELPRLVEQERAPRRRLGLAREAGQDLRLGLRPDPRHAPQPPAAAAARSSSAVRTPSARAISTERFAPRPR